MGRTQPGVGLWSPHFFVLHFFESGLTLNPHNKRHSFGLFISLYLCCVVDCIKVNMTHFKYIQTNYRMRNFVVLISRLLFIDHALKINVSKLFDFDVYICC